MLMLTANLILTFLVFALALRLVSKKHHCEKLSFLLYGFLFFMCVIDLQALPFDRQAVELFWWCALGLGGVLMVYFTTSKKTRYYIKDLDLTQEEHLGALEELVRRYARENLKTFAVEFKYRSLVFDQVQEDQQKELVRLIDEYISTNDCTNSKDWRFMIIFAISVQLIFMVIMLIYKLTVML